MHTIYHRALAWFHRVYYHTITHIDFGSIDRPPVSQLPTSKLPLPLSDTLYHASVLRVGMQQDALLCGQENQQKIGEKPIDL